METQNVIEIRGARTHNLKNLNIDIKIGKITCFAGPSGSGKSSIAFHTLLTESKRRFINSLPTDMKFFWELSQSVDVDKIYPVLPVWGLPQHNPMQNSRPVALDVLGGHERLQRLFMVLGEYLCPVHAVHFKKVTTLEGQVESLKKEIAEDEVVHLFCKKDEYLRNVSREFMPMRSFEEELNDFNEEDSWYELFRVKGKNLDQVLEKFKESKLNHEAEVLIYLKNAHESYEFHNETYYQCPHCDETTDFVKEENYQALSPLNALGACSDCEGHGANLVFDRAKLVKDPSKTIREGAINFLNFSHFLPLFSTFLKELKKAGYDADVPFNELPESIWKFLYEGQGNYSGFNDYFAYLKTQRYKKNIRIYTRGLQTEEMCLSCEGTRVSAIAGRLSLVVGNEVISFKDFLKLNFFDSKEVLIQLRPTMVEQLKKQKILSSFDKLLSVYQIADDLGLNHIQNTRKVKSLSTSEYQRILLSKYLCYEGSQSLFILDEPSLGLSLKTQAHLFSYLEELKKQGNTIILVEHSEFLKSKSDEIVQMGPGAGELGGEIVYQGPYKKQEIKLNFIKDKNLKAKSYIELRDVRVREIFKSEVKIGKNVINWVFGESGTGKTSVIIDVLGNEVHKKIYSAKMNNCEYEFKKITGIDNLTDVIIINSSVDKISSRSTIGTFTDLGAYVRKYFAGLTVSKNLGLKDGHFSSNSELGQCISCEGKGVKTVEMHFMEDVEFTCEDCQGKKLRPFYANISDGGMTAYEAFNHPLGDILKRMKLTPKGARIYEYFKILKLDYLALDRTLVSLSGGERQRLKLISLLDKKIENALIIFENLTSGLSHIELDPLAQLLTGLALKGNTIVVIDQNPLLEQMVQEKIEF